MLSPIKVVDIELNQPLQDIKDLAGYAKLHALVRFHNTPIGYITVPVYGDFCPVNVIAKEIVDQHTRKILRELAYNGLADPMDGDGFTVEKLLAWNPRKPEGALPLVTVAVCTRNGTDRLTLCLDSLKNLDYPALDLIVIDNAPTSERTKKLVKKKFPQMRYVLEPRPGLNWARNRAILEARGEIIAYTDDDVVVDTHWVRALSQAFTENHKVMAITGLVVPFELETDAQILFEMYGGFGRGFERKWYHRNKTYRINTYYIGSGACGTGANMAFRRSLFDLIGLFDPAMDVGTVTNGGGDLDMFYRVIHEGHLLLYEPRVIVRHRHRREYKKLKEQIANNGIGLSAHFVRNALNYHREFFKISGFWIWWLFYWDVRRLFIHFSRPSLFPKDLVLAEFFGLFKGLFRYQRARRRAARIERTFGPSDIKMESNGKMLKQMLNNKEPEKNRCDESTPISRAVK
jgi:glycosyltransferase involved in cell wall biosynthesis